mgnify:CR=1 FL=1
MTWKSIGYWLPPAAWAAGIFALSSMTFPPKPPAFPAQDKVAHMVLYAVLAALLFRAFRRERQWGFRKAAWAALVVASLYGVTDEFHQYFTPTRSVEFLDWLADTAGAAVVFLACLRRGQDAESSSRS